MFKTALLVVTKPLSHVQRALPEYLSEINKLVLKTAYIHIQPLAIKMCKVELMAVPFTTEIRNIVRDFYVSGAKFCAKVDIRILIGHFSNSTLNFKKYELGNMCDIVLIDQVIPSDNISNFRSSLCNHFSIGSLTPVQSIDVGLDSRAGLDTGVDCKTLSKDCVQASKRQKQDDNYVEKEKTRAVIHQYSDTVLGGTFDRLHVGHKLLLSEGCLLATRRLIVGVTDGNMNNKKLLAEFIEPIDTRINNLQKFLHDVKPSLEYKLEPITDIYGPSTREPDIDLIVLSQETKNGGDKVNKERSNKGLRQLQEYTIDLIEDFCHSQYEEEKISSSSERKRLLGTLYHTLKAKDGFCKTSYIIGLTGGIASGKSAVCKRLEGLGAKIVDCDKLGHRAYVKGTPGFDKVVKAFGQDIVAADGEVDRKVLGKIVFGDKAKLTELNNIVWPEIAKLIQEQIKIYAKDGQNVIVLDAAILLEASWDEMCHEVWTTIVPPAEAIHRMMDRNKLTEEQARLRLDSQISNMERVRRSNVILCTLWEYEYTQQQVEKAWKLLMNRLPKVDSLEKEKVKAKSNI